MLTVLISAALAVPVEMNHQGRMLDSNGAGLTGSQVITFRLFDSESGGTVLWSSAVAVEFDNGYYSVQLGEDGSLDTESLAQYPVFLELEFSGSDPMEPRYPVSSVPYSFISELAESVEGPVDATEISVNGTMIIDSDGNWVGPEIEGSSSGGSTGGSTGSSSVYWTDIQSRPLGLDDGDDFLTESDVENYITNDFINLASGSRMGGYDILTTNSSLSFQWSSILGVPADLSDGDDDTQLSEQDVETYVVNGSINLASGSMVGGSAILTSSSSVDWSALSNVPNGLSDGDDDTLSGIACASGDLVSWNGAAFECVAPSQQSLDGSIVDLAAGSTVGGSAIATQDDLTAPDWGSITGIPGDIQDGDNDSFADVSCQSGETITWDGTDWICTSLAVDFSDLGNIPAGLDDGDDDTLGVLVCSEGQVAVYSESAGGWVCGDGGGASGELAVVNQIGSSDGGTFYDSLDANPDAPATIPDNNEFGFTSTLYVSAPLTIETLSIDLNISHEDMGEVTATLTSPAGTDIVLYNGDHPGQVNFSGNLGWNPGGENDIHGGDLYSYYGEDVVGTWMLNVTDNVGVNDDGDSFAGTLDGWTIRFNEDWDGEIFVGDNVTVQETVAVRGELRVEYGADLILTNTDGEETFKIEAETGKVTIGGNAGGTVQDNEEFIPQVFWNSTESSINTGGTCWYYDEIYATCPEGTAIISGSCEMVSGTLPWGYSANEMSGNSWRCETQHCGSYTFTHKARALCMNTSP
ncbi:MAG: hypothetical protein CMK59_00115 [Proteobacteria bacterium]|nr:hypothetical protein [Pseudomonadota bacterium]